MQYQCKCKIQIISWYRVYESKSRLTFLIAINFPNRAHFLYSSISGLEQDIDNPSYMYLHPNT